MPEPARLREVVVQVMHLHVEDQLVAGDRGTRSVEVTDRVRVQQVATTGRAGARRARSRVQGQQHERGTAHRAQELAPAHAQEPGLRVGRLVRAADRLGLHRRHRRRDELAVRARLDLDG